MSAEFIVGMLSNPDAMTILQRRMWEENKYLVIGDLKKVSGLQARYHHYFRYAEIVYNYWWDSGLTKPWNNTNFDQFHLQAKDFSRRSANKYYKSIRTEIAVAKIGKSKYELNYLEDVIGKTVEENSGFELSTYLYTLNFLLRANRNPNQILTFSSKMDSICNSCRGGVNEVGDHCRDYIPLDLTTENLLKKKMSQGGIYSQYIVKDKRPKSLGIVLGAFFDESFLDGISL